MTSIQVAAPLTIKRILYLADFSPSSEAVLPFAIALARKYAASIEVLHVLTPAIPESCPDAVQADLDLAEAEMNKIRPKIAGIPCNTTVTSGMSLWQAIDQTIRERHIDLLVAGTHGRTGVPRLLLGSVAEEVFRRSPVPVLTVGPFVRNKLANGMRLDRVLLATDFSSASEAAAAYALSCAQEDQAHLILLNVMRKTEARNPLEVKALEASVAETIDRLHQIVPRQVPLYNPAEVLVEYGGAADRIVGVATERNVDLIVMGVRNAAGHLGAATHLERATAHQVVIHASCPVLTVRATEMAASVEERTFR